MSSATALAKNDSPMRLKTRITELLGTRSWRSCDGRTRNSRTSRIWSVEHRDECWKG